MNKKTERFLLASILFVGGIIALTVFLAGMAHVTNVGWVIDCLPFTDAIVLEGAASEKAEIFVPVLLGVDLSTTGTIRGQPFEVAVEEAPVCERLHVADLEAGDQIRKALADALAGHLHDAPPPHGHKLPPELVVVGEKDGVLFLRAVGGNKPFLRLTSGDAATTKTK